MLSQNKITQIKRYSELAKHGHIRTFSSILQLIPKELYVLTSKQLGKVVDIVYQGKLVGETTMYKELTNG